MIGIVVVTHGDLACAMVKTVELVIGPQAALEPVCLNAFEGLDDLKAKVSEAIAKAGKESGGNVLIFTDMFGGSTTNVSLQFISEKVEPKLCLSTEKRRQRAQHTIASLNSDSPYAKAMALCCDWLILQNAFGTWKFPANVNFEK